MEAQSISMEEQQKTWIPDAQALSCITCFRQFTWRLRRHHCRLCGQVFCNNCSAETTTRIDHGTQQKVRLCTKCNEINTTFNQDLDRNQPLLQNQLSDGNRDKDNYFTVVSRRESKQKDQEERKMSFNVEMLGQDVKQGDTITSECFFNGFEFETTEYKKRISIARPEARKSIVEDMRSDLAQKSNQQQIVLQKFFRMDHYGRSDTSDEKQAEEDRVDESTKRRENSKCDHRLTETINKNFDSHVEHMVKLVMAEFKINQEQWFKIVHDCTRQTVLTVKPTSVILNDTIDINAFVKIVTIHHPNQSKCRYVNGIVFKKDIANRHMRSDIQTPRILLLRNSLGYVQEDGLALLDLEREVEQEDQLVKNIKLKIEQVNPSIIFVEKDASRLVLDMLLKENRTVVTNTALKMLYMIARQTQTIICPNSNFISKGFKIGECGQFKTEQVKGQGQDLYKQQTSLLCLEGCRAELGCTIVLSGNDQTELKSVRHAMRKCIGLARSLLHEREYLKFIRPDLGVPQSQDSADHVSEEQEMDFGGKAMDLGRKAQSASSRYSINDPLNGQPDLQAPFLFEKMIERQSLIFEHFSLAFPQKKSQTAEESKSQVKVNPDEKDQSKASSELGKSVEDTTHAQNEAEIKRKLKRMCSKPVRQKIDFYSSKTDVSVFTMIKRLAKQSITNCQADTCQKPRVAHTDYWYHGNGCVEIKFVLMDDHHKVVTNAIQKQLEQQQQILIYAFCSKCQSMIIKKRPAPIELLEMSFFKFLEQFFYNQDVKTMHLNASGKPCEHTFHLDSQILFRYGPVKIMFQFEKIEEYTLDLIHFGKTPGIFSQQEVKQKVRDDLLYTIEHFEKALFWIDEKATVIQNWLVDAVKELPQILGAMELKPTLNSLREFVIAFQANFTEFKDYITKKLFKSSQDDSMKQITEILNRSTQGGRISKLISERISEYVFLLRKAQQYLVDNLLAKYFPFKKQTLQQFLLPQNDRLDESFVSVGRPESHNQSSLQSTSVIEQQQQPQLRAHRGSSKTESKISSHHSVDPYMNPVPLDAPPQQQLTRMATMIDLTPPEQYPKSTLTHPQASISPQLKRDFREVYLFDDHLHQNESIKHITAQCAFLAFGYNQGSVRVKPFDFTSMIAMTLNSNLYLSGLAQMDYMEMNEKIIPFTPDSVAGQESKVKAGEIFAGASKMLTRQSRDNLKGNQPVAFIKDQDVLNQHVAFALAEAELTKPTDWEMLLEFSTSQKPFIRIEKGEGEELIINEEEGNAMLFYDHAEPIIELGSFLEQPVPTKLFEHLGIVTQTNHLNASSRYDATKGQTTQTNTQQYNRLQTEAGAFQPIQRPLTADQARSDVYHLFHEQFEFSVKVYYPGHFEALRKIYCGGYSDFIQSFAESHYWKDNSGGKSRSTFFMSSDQKYVMKAVKGSEIKMFEEMAGSYFDYLKESFARQCPTTIAKTLGIFKIKIRLDNRSRSEQFYLVLMENLLLHVDDCCVRYDLKGSFRNRYITKKSSNEVTLDNNFLQDMKSRPIPLQYSMKRILNLAIHNDSLYLSKQSIIDYSMFVIINPIKKTVRLGIIDYIQQYTIEKSIESYLKSGLGQGEPTIIPPEMYKNRFRTAMDKYFVAMMPDKDRKVTTLMNSLFQADKIQWFTKETDKAVV